MKKSIKVALLFMLAVAQVSSVKASNSSDPEVLKYSPIDLRLQGERPRGATNTPDCYYLYVGMVCISATGNITGINATVTSLNSNQQFNGTAFDNELSIIVPTDPGTYSIEISLSDGTFYYGEYTL